MDVRNCFCTIVTPDYIPYAQTLFKSLKRQSKNMIPFFILVTGENENASSSGTAVEEMNFLFIAELCEDGMGKKIKDKYFLNDMDSFRWSMKPVLINYLIKNKDFSKVLFLDCDLYFYSDYQFLFDLLDENKVLLTPHWRSSDPHADPGNFQLQYTSGLYNGGFIGVNHEATEIMDWWAKACEYVCEKNPAAGNFVDQTHMNLMPIFFTGVEIVRHKGCNVANWNQIECKRIKKANGEVLINDQYPIIFIHFTNSTIYGILKGADRLLMPYLEQFALTLNSLKPGFDLINSFKMALANKRSNKGRVNTLISVVRKWMK